MAASRGDHARVLPGTLVNNRYEIGQELGRGNFSVVYGAKDKMAGNAAVALKFVKKEYAHDAKFEYDILKAVRDANPTGDEKVLTMLDHFVFNRFPCFVLAPKGCPLKARRMGVREGHVGRGELRALTKQMCEALAFLHFKMKLVHTDLKPENILLDSTPTSSRGLGDGFTIVDFGSASFYRMDRLDSDLISTRPYRSPEVVLGNGWYYPADTWSLGCILYEVYTGHKLFDVNDDHIHLAQMTARLGPLPKIFTHDSHNSRKFFDSNGQFARGPQLRAAPYIRHVAEELRDDSAFCDLIMSMLAFEPGRRIRCDEALRHPFIVGESAGAARKTPSPLADGMPALRKEPSPLNPIPSAAAGRHAMPAPSASSSALDKENARGVVGAPSMVNKPLYGNIRLGALNSNPSSATSSTNATPLTARGPAPTSSYSTNPYGLNAPMSARPSLISPSTNVGRGPLGALNTNAYANAYGSSGSTADDRLNALKRAKSDPSLMPAAGRATGIQYVSRAW